MIESLDSWAILHWLDGDEPAAARVEAAIPSRPVMSWINLGEVAYIVERRAGVDRARRVVRELRPRLTLDLPSEARVLEAAHLKAGYTMAYADAFAVATAIAHGATLLTGDPEILNGDPTWPVEDLRS
ncbi:MAG: type II toxin-antitoxin system VapC family toxin [Actinomycetota bacterium]|nr:type II toxin-antitoxin system VapC family toxin [Actinomycetota bacterium]